MYHFVKVKNLPFSLDDVKRVCSQCTTCSELKPRFFRPPPGKLVRAMQPFDRISIDFTGPKPSATKNKYLLVMIDEYSRFPFAFPCPDMSAQTVISCFLQLFSIFGCPSAVHSDRAAQFMSREVSEFLANHGVVMTHSTPYHPQGNSQCEREVRTIWRTVRLALRSLKLPDHQWEHVLGRALHSIRSLLCTATNQTPHERLFAFSRKSSNGYSLPSWLSSPGPVLLRKFVRRSKSDPLVEYVDLENATPHYALVRHPDGRKTTVSTRDLAPAPATSTPSQEGSTVSDQMVPAHTSGTEGIPTVREAETIPPEAESTPTSSPPDWSCSPSATTDATTLRRSNRIRKVPDRLGY